MNRTAKEFCRVLDFSNVKASLADYVPEMLIEDCRTLVHQSLSNPAGILPLTCHRTFCIGGAPRIMTSSRIVSEEISSEKERFFLIYLEEQKSPLPSTENQLKNQYSLTSRECEIVRYLYEGLKNTEIAKKVFLSEITVKKHLQSIFKKLKVPNRASAVRKIAETFQPFN
jgi:DNA-binding NarL/FixJ family response regulator